MTDSKRASSFSFHSLYHCVFDVVDYGLVLMRMASHINGNDVHYVTSTQFFLFNPFYSTPYTSGAAGRTCPSISVCHCTLPIDKWSQLIPIGSRHYTDVEM